MAEKSLQARIQNKCDTTANWAKATNFVPKKGEIIVYSDGGGTGVPKMKVGDGTTVVGSLKFITATVPDASATVSGIVNTGEQTFGGNKTFRGTFRVISASGTGPNVALGAADSSTDYLYLDRSTLGFGKINNSSANTQTRLTFSNNQIEVRGAIVSSASNPYKNLGSSDTPWTNGYITNLHGNADTATTATTASKVSNSLSINGKTYNGSAAVDVGAVSIAYGGTGKTTRKEALGALLGQTSTTNLNEVLEQGTYKWGNATGVDNAPTNYGTLISLLNTGDIHDNSSNWLTHIAIGTNNTIYWRQKINSQQFLSWRTLLDSNNYSTYAATKDHNHDDIYLKALPIASSSTLGGVKIGSGLTVAEDGTISAAAEYTLPTASTSVKGGIKVGSGLTMSSETLNHSNSITAKTAYGSTATTASANGGKIVVTDVKYDAQGHITGSTDRTITLSQTTYTLAGLMGSTAKGSATQPVYWNGSAWTNTTHTLGKSVPADAKFTDTVYTLPTASSTLGGVKTTSTVSATTGLTACPIIDGVVYYKDTNNTYTLAGLVGSTAIGTATNPIYWDGSKFVKTTYTLGKSVPADAKFTDTVYSLPAATTTTLGGIIAGSGLSITTEGKLSVSKVPNALSINGKSFDGSAAIDVGVIGAAYGGSGKTSLSASANAFLNSLPYGSTSEATLTDDHSFYMNGLTGQTNYKVPMSSVYTYVKGKLDSVYQPVGSYLTAIPKATTSVLGGIKLGAGLTAADDGTVNVSVGGATITLKTWTDADVA